MSPIRLCRLLRQLYSRISRYISIKRCCFLRWLRRFGEFPTKADRRPRLYTMPAVCSIPTEAGLDRPMPLIHKAITTAVFAMNPDGDFVPCIMLDPKPSAPLAPYKGRLASRGAILEKLGDPIACYTGGIGEGVKVAPLSTLKCINSHPEPKWNNGRYICFDTTGPRIPSVFEVFEDIVGIIQQTHTSSEDKLQSDIIEKAQTMLRSDKAVVIEAKPVFKWQRCAKLEGGFYLDVTFEIRECGEGVWAS